MTQTLRRAPQNNDKHLWADYFELACLLSDEGRLSWGDAEEQADQLADVSAQTLQAGPTDGASAAELVDDRRLAVADVFSHLQYRETTFGTSYPFQMTAQALSLAEPEPAAEAARLLYRLLLVSSALEHLEPGQRQTVTAAFEGLAHDAIRALLPEPVSVRHFGTNPTGHPAFEGELKEKVKALADALGEQASAEEGLYREPNLADGGLDIVAWLPFKDKARAALAVFVQATCKKDWKEKPGEIRYDKWKQMLTLLAQPPTVLVIPYCFRSPDGGWYVGTDITSVTIDRQRIMDLLRHQAVEPAGGVRTIVDGFRGAAAAA